MKLIKLIDDLTLILKEDGDMNVHIFNQDNGCPMQIKDELDVVIITSPSLFIHASTDALRTTISDPSRTP